MTSGEAPVDVRVDVGSVAASGPLLEVGDLRVDFHHGGRTIDGVLTRAWQRLLALTAVIWHNDRTGQDVKRSLIAYDH